MYTHSMYVSFRGRRYAAYIEFPNKLREKRVRKPLHGFLKREKGEL